jgi:glyoxylase-like metal-dependent hydrolase (beta-lactamase superfamily II)
MIVRNGVATPAFPNAKYYCAKGEFEHARELHVRDAISYVPANFVPLLKSGHLRLVDGAYEPVPGIRMLPAPGHNKDIVVVLAQSAGETFCFFSDVVPTAAHLMPTWIAAFDLFPLDAIATKTDWLARAAGERWLCGFGHDPAVGFARVNERYQISEDLTNAAARTP